MEVKDLLPNGQLPVYLAFKDVKELVVIGKENLEAMIKRWLELCDGVDKVIKIIDSYSSPDQNKKNVDFFLIGKDLENVMLPVGDSSEVVEKILAPLKVYYSEKISVLSDLATKAESKPLFPFFREIDYALVDDIYLLEKRNNRIPWWVKGKAEVVEMMIVSCGYCRIKMIKVGSIIFDHYNPRLLAASELKYLRKNRDFAKIWVNSTRLAFNHKKRHSLLYSFN